MGNEDRRAGFDEIMALGQRFRSEDDPVTRRQVEVFIDRPGGPIVSGDCVAMQRLDQFGIDIAYHCRRGVQIVCDIIVNPQNEPCLAVVNNFDNEERWIINGSNRYRLESDDRSIDNRIIRLLGFTSDGKPVAVFADLDNLVGQGVTTQRRVRVFFGDKIVYTKDESIVHSFSWIPRKGLYIARGSDQKVFRVDPQDPFSRQIIAAPLLYKFFVDVGASGVMGCWDSYKPMNWPTEYLQPIEVDGVEQIMGSFSYVFSGREKCPFLVVKKPIDGSPMSARVEQIPASTQLNDIVQVRLAGMVNYYSQGQSTPAESQPAFVMPARYASHSHRYECWVLRGEYGPPFQRVSPLFERDQRTFYYGVLGPHLYTMKF